MKNNLAARSAIAISTPDFRCFIAASRPAAQLKIVHLQRAKIIRLEKSSIVKNIEVKKGAIWLTGTPADGDVLLQPNDCFELTDKWPFVIQALEQAEISLF